MLPLCDQIKSNLLTIWGMKAPKVPAATNGKVLPTCHFIKTAHVGAAGAQIIMKNPVHESPHP